MMMMMMMMIIRLNVKQYLRIVVEVRLWKIIVPSVTRYLYLYLYLHLHLYLYLYLYQYLHLYLYACVRSSCFSFKCIYICMCANQ